MFAFVATALDERKDNHWFGLTWCVCFCVFASLNLLYMIIYSLCKVKGYSFDENTSTEHFAQYFVRLIVLFLYYVHFPISSVGLLMKSIFAWTYPEWRMSRQHFHNICFELDETWCVNYRRLDEPWVPPGFNCLHHQSDCKLTDSAGHQLVKRLQQNRRLGRDDGVIRYLCFLLCLVQQGVAHSTGSWYSICH